jgi:UDP-N-acetylmuramoyl-tripeptide--D-alanyl-D-alanine ligase
MRARRLSDVAAVTGGRLIGDDVEVRSVVVDGRIKDADSALFVAIAGERADGHDFVLQALEGPSVAAMIERETDSTAGIPAVVVESTMKGLADLARAERSAMRAAVIGVTGSTGKTMTKDLIAAVLSPRFDVVASANSFNNEIGLPLTLLESNASTEVVVAEMGSRGVGHIASLTEIASPTAGVITNVGVAHMELFGSQENVADAKAELVESLDARGTAILPIDDPVVRTFGGRTKANVLWFGRGDDARVRAESVTLDADGNAHFVLAVDDAREPVALSIPGEHMVSNALAAAAAGVLLGLSVAEIAAGLKDAHVSAWRMETFTGAGGVRVINDAYNANPTSMAAALKAARWIARDGRLAAVLGTMRELGHLSEREHERVGELVARLGIERLITVGDEAEPILRAAIREGVEPENAVAYATGEDALEDVRAWAHEGDVVLFKGSRAVGLEKLAEAMR